MRMSDWSSDVCSSDLALPALAEGEYYHHDLIGLPCVSTDGRDIGHVAAVENFGAGDLLQIEKPDRQRFMVPLTVHAVAAGNEAGVTVEASTYERRVGAKEVSPCKTWGSPQPSQKKKTRTT